MPENQTKGNLMIIEYSDYQAIHKNSARYGITDLGNFADKVGCRNISLDQIIDYVANRTDVAFRRGYWKATHERKY